MNDSFKLCLTSVKYINEEISTLYYTVLNLKCFYQMYNIFYKINFNFIINNNNC